MKALIEAGDLKWLMKAALSVRAPVDDLIRLRSKDGVLGVAVCSFQYALTAVRPWMTPERIAVAAPGVQVAQQEWQPSDWDLTIDRAAADLIARMAVGDRVEVEVDEIEISFETPAITLGVTSTGSLLPPLPAAPAQPKCITFQAAELRDLLLRRASGDMRLRADREKGQMVLETPPRHEEGIMDALGAWRIGQVEAAGDMYPLLVDSRDLCRTLRAGGKLGELVFRTQASGKPARLDSESASWSLTVLPLRPEKDQPSSTRRTSAETSTATL